MATRYVHTNIVCRDWRELADFYIKLFECRPLLPERDLSGEWLAKGTGVEQAAISGVHLQMPGYGENGPTLEIYEYTEMKDKPAPAANRLGIGHLAFQVDDVANKLQQVLNAVGQKLGDISQHYVNGVGQLTFVYTTDPEGNILELQHWH